ncbi:MAG: hypothetical protein ABSE82_06645 [Nitrososphaerales archaeon]
MTSQSLRSHNLRLPSFGLIVPTQWSRVDTSDKAKFEAIGDQLTKLLPDQSDARIRQDVFDYWRSLVDTNVTQYFTYARPARDKALIQIFICTIGQFDANPDQEFQDAAQDLFRSLDQGWDAPPPMLTMHENASGEYFRAERLIEEPGKWPWEASREVQYLFRHPVFPVYALLTGVSPNTEIPEISAQFDQVAATFFWLPS